MSSLVRAIPFRLHKMTLRLKSRAAGAAATVALGSDGSSVHSQPSYFSQEEDSSDEEL